MRRTAIVLAAAALIGCNDEGPMDPDPLPTDSEGVMALDAVQAQPLVVASRNLYLGGDIDRVLGAPSPSEIPLRTLQTWMEIGSSDFPARARAMAREFAEDPPHVIGLQEAPLFRIQSPGDAVVGGSTPAETVVIDYLDVILWALQEEGLTYRVAYMVENVDVELPIPTSPTTFDDVRFTDRDAILVRDDVTILSADGGNFAATYTVSVAGAVPVVLKRGWTEAIVEFRGAPYRVVNAHLEQQRFRPIQEAQMAELLGRIDDAPEPTILVGDLNSEADGSNTASYAMALAAGFEDTWLRPGSEGDGFTCCYRKDLTGGLDAMVERIDFVLLRNPFDRGAAGQAGSVEASLLGADLGDRTASGLWPSDHRGLSTRFRIPVPGFAGGR
jgi:hypothetical protein